MPRRFYRVDVRARRLAEAGLSLLDRFRNGRIVEYILLFDQ